MAERWHDEREDAGYVTAGSAQGDEKRRQRRRRQTGDQAPRHRTQVAESIVALQMVAAVLPAGQERAGDRHTPRPTWAVCDAL